MTYYEQNKEKIKKYRKEYLEKNKEKIKKYRELNKGKISEWSRKYRKTKHNIEYRKKYYRKNKEKIKQQTKRRRNTSSGKFRAYIKGAKERNIKFCLTFKEFENFWQKPCRYCGDKIKTIGLDRVNNKKGYIIDNVVPCCEKCNRMKNSYNKKDFINHCIKIVRKNTK